MKVKDIVLKCRLIDTKFQFCVLGKIIDEKPMTDLYKKEEPEIMKRTVNSWEIKEGKMLIWLKPLDTEW